MGKFGFFITGAILGAIWGVVAQKQQQESAAKNDAIKASTESQESEEQAPETATVAEETATA